MTFGSNIDAERQKMSQSLEHPRLQIVFCKYKLMPETHFSIYFFLVELYIIL